MPILTGTNGADEILGTRRRDVIDGLGGDDTIDGAAGDDRIDGGGGSDAVRGRDGGDLIRGGNGQDSLDGGSGADRLDGGRGADLLLYDLTENGGLGNTTADVCNGGTGFDTLGLTLSLADYLDASFQAEISGVLAALAGGTKNVAFTSFGLVARNIERITLEVIGTAGNDTIVGIGTDTALRGAGGADILLGSAGNDTLVGGDGADVMFGSGGADIFVVQRGDGVDTIIDFTDGVDLLGLEEGLEGRAITFADNGVGGTEVAIDGALVATVDGVAAGALSVDDFVMI